MTDNKSYSEKLKDPRWQKKRLEIMQRDEFACKNCGDTETTLYVHHQIYKSNPWDSPDEDLVTLCESCHEEEHTLELEAKEGIKYYLDKFHGRQKNNLAFILQELDSIDGMSINEAMKCLTRFFSEKEIFDKIKDSIKKMNGVKNG